MLRKPLSQGFLICISLVLLLSLVFSTVSCSEETTTTQETAEPITIVVTTHEAPGTFWQTKVFDPWFAEIEERTNGQVKFEVHWNAELFSPMDAYNATASGAVDMAYVFQMMVPGKFSMDEINNFYPVTSNQWKQSQVYWELYEKYPELQAEYDETHLISLGAFLGKGIGTTNKPIYTLEDIKGQKLMAAGEWGANILDELGAVPMSVAPAEIVISVQNGTVDGGTCPIFLLQIMDLGNLYSYFANVNTYGVPLCFVMNKDTWNKLPADVQEVFNDLGGEYFAKLVDDTLKDVEQGILDSAATEYPSLTINQISDEEALRWGEAYDAVLEDYIEMLNGKGLPGEKFVEDFFEIEKKYAE